jgi:hypothetical protein
VGLLLVLLLLLALVAIYPAHPYSRGWGYRPLGGVGAILAVALVLLLAGWFPGGWGLGTDPTRVAQ